MAARVRPALHLKDAGHSTDGRTGFGAPPTKTIGPAVNFPKTANMTVL